MKHRALALTLLLASGAALTACGGAQPGEQSYAGSARRSFQLGEEALADGDYEEAIRHFAFVKNKFAYSKYAAQAELRIADALFEQEKYIEAIDAYQLFVQAHPSHRDVPYAMWRIGDAHFRQIPGDFILFPPSHEKDQAATRDALRALDRYVQRFPKDQHLDKAQERIRDCRRLLADHELYVARFYLRDDRPVSARGRLEAVVNDFGDLADRWSQAALLLVRVYVDLGLNAEARSLAERLVAEHPDRPEARGARRLLADLE